MQISSISVTDQYKTKGSNLRKQNVSNVVLNNQSSLNFKANPKLVSEFQIEANKVMSVAKKKGNNTLINIIQRFLNDIKIVSDNVLKEKLEVLTALALGLGITAEETTEIVTTEEKTKNSNENNENKYSLYTTDGTINSNEADFEKVKHLVNMTEIIDRASESTRPRFKKDQILEFIKIGLDKVIPWADITNKYGNYRFTYREIVELSKLVELGRVKHLVEMKNEYDDYRFNGDDIIKLSKFGLDKVNSLIYMTKKDGNYRFGHYDIEHLIEVGLDKAEYWINIKGKDGDYRYDGDDICKLTRANIPPEQINKFADIKDEKGNYRFDGCDAVNLVLSKLDLATIMHYANMKDKNGKYRFNGDNILSFSKVDSKKIDPLISMTDEYGNYRFSGYNIGDFINTGLDKTIPYIYLKDKDGNFCFSKYDIVKFAENKDIDFEKVQDIVKLHNQLGVNPTSFNCGRLAKSELTVQQIKDKIDYFVNNGGCTHKEAIEEIVYCYTS